MEQPTKDLSEKVSRAPTTVALVEDHQLVLDGITAHLQAQAGLQVVASESTWIGLLSHREFPPDVVVLDLHLTDLISIGTKLRTLTDAGARVVVISRHADTAAIDGLFAHGAHGFVSKSDSADVLVNAIHSAAKNTIFGNRRSVTTIVHTDVAPSPRLGNQERKALMLYASGRPMKDVATTMVTTEDTVKSYIKRARRKYRTVGIDIGTRALLRQRAVVEGWLGPE